MSAPTCSPASCRCARRPRLELALYILFFFPGVMALLYVGTGFAAQSWGEFEVSS